MDKLIAIKDHGNDLYKQQQYTKAITCYEEALTLVNYRL